MTVVACNVERIGGEPKGGELRTYCISERAKVGIKWVLSSSKPLFLCCNEGLRQCCRKHGYDTETKRPLSYS